jgi:hypothetical protein
MFGPRFEPAGTSENWWNLIKSAALMKMIMMQSSLFMLLFLLNSCNRAVKWRQWRRALLAADAMLAWRTVSLWLTRWQETEAFESKVKWCIFLPRKGPVCKVCIPKKFHTLRYIQCQQIQQLTQTEQKGEPGHVWDSLGKQGKPRSDKLLHSENRNSLER